jgi:hypothetical protein
MCGNYWNRIRGGLFRMTGMTDTSIFIEENIINSVKSLLSGRVNELLGELEYPIPPVEFGDYRGGSAIVPVIALSTCEREEKERIIRIDTYAVSITFPVAEGEGAEAYCYAYAAAVDKALDENPTLGGIVSRAELTGKAYSPPKKTRCGEGWRLVLTLRVTVEQVAHAY